MYSLASVATITRIVKARMVSRYRLHLSESVMYKYDCVHVHVLKNSYDCMYLLARVLWRWARNIMTTRPRLALPLRQLRPALRAPAGPLA
jgi:hypothetical protein